MTASLVRFREEPGARLVLAALRRVAARHQEAADKQFSLWRQNPQHRSLHFKRIRHNLWSARVNDNDRALATFDGDTWLWFWSGQHDEYERLLKDDR